MSISYNKLPRPEFEKLLKDRFPLMYRDLYGNPRETCMAWGADIGPGWYDILYEASEKLEEIAKKQPLPKQQNTFQKLCWKIIGMIVDKFPNVYNKIKWDGISGKIYIYFEPPEDRRLTFTQIKEKFGTICLYINYYYDDINEIIKTAGKRSAETCEDCGAPGTLRSRRGWLSVRCGSCS